MPFGAGRASGRRRGPPARDAAGTPRADARPARSLKSRAIALLARREYSRAELRARLLGPGARHDPDATAAVDAVLEELAAAGYLSDARYAEAMVKRKAGAYSRRAIADTLAAQGVARETIGAALDDAPVDDAQAMRALWERRFGRPAANEREKARQIRFLQSRGFGLSAIIAFLRKLPLQSDDDAT